MAISEIIVTGAVGDTGSVTVPEPLKVGYCGPTMVSRDDSPNEQTSLKRHLFKITALFLLLLSTHGAFAGEIKPYNQADFEKLAVAGKAILLDFRADWCTVCAAQAPLIRELMAQSKYKDLTTFTIDFDTAAALRKAYRVAMQSTLIVLTGKHEDGRSVGDTSREGIDRLLDGAVH
jgi:thioredoxin